MAAVVAAAVVIDLPSPASSTYRRSQLTSYLSTVHGDVAQCNDGLRDAVRVYVGWARGDKGRTRSLAATFVRQAIAVCSFANAGVVNLGTTQPPRAASSPTVVAIAHQVDAWAYLDAFDTLQDLRATVADPAALAPFRAAQQDLTRLHARRRHIENLVTTAERAAGMHPAAFALIDVATLLPTGTLPPPPGAPS